MIFVAVVGLNAREMIGEPRGLTRNGTAAESALLPLVSKARAIRLAEPTVAGVHEIE